MKTLAVKKGFFTAGFTYRISLQTWRAGGRKSFNVIKRDIDTSPENGTCSLTPMQGEAMVTLFKITCLGWKDKDLPLKYRYFYQKDNDFIELYGGTSKQSSSLLPMGDASSNYSINVIAEIQDSLGSTTRASMAVQVRKKLIRKPVIKLSNNSKPFNKTTSKIS